MGGACCTGSVLLHASVASDAAWSVLACSIDASFRMHVMLLVALHSAELPAAILPQFTSTAM